VAVNLVQPHLDYALACASTALAANPPGRAFVAPGQEVAWDDCCDGQLHVRLISLGPDNALQTRKASGQPCGPEFWIATIGLGIVRCAHTVDDEGNAPTPGQISSDANDMTGDLTALLDAITCCIRPTSITGWTPVGPLGGCHGGEWVYTVRIPACDC
jgi:hypothetical protein